MAAGFVDRFFGPTIGGAISGLTDKVVAATREEITKYAPQLLAMGKEQFEKYFPELLALAKEELEKYAPQLVQAAKDEMHAQMEHWMPILMTGLAKTVTTSIAHIGGEGGPIDKLTDMTPGDIDDKVVDPITKELFGWLGGVFGGAIPQIGSADGRS